MNPEYANMRIDQLQYIVGYKQEEIEKLIKEISGIYDAIDEKEYQQEYQRSKEMSTYEYD